MIRHSMRVWNGVIDELDLLGAWATRLKKTLGSQIYRVHGIQSFPKCSLASLPVSHPSFCCLASDEKLDERAWEQGYVETII